MEPDGLSKYICACGCDIASERVLVWEGFMGASTPALLFRDAVNVEASQELREERLSTGRYMLVDVSAAAGWCRRPCQSSL